MSENAGRRFTRRHWARETVALLLWPVSMLQSKHRGRGVAPLSAQRCILAASVWLFIARPLSDWSWPAVGALAVLNSVLVVETLFMNVPVREGLAALVAVFGGMVAKRTRSVTVEEEVQAPTPTSTAALDPDFEPHAWTDGNPDEGEL